MSVKVKICGIRSRESALAAVEAGADFLGFNFIANSRRFISPSMARKIISDIKGKAKIVGVFQNSDITYIKDIVDLLDLDFVELHGDENQEFVKKINAKVIKAICVPKNASLDQLVAQMQNYQVSYFLIDREKQGEGNIIDKEIAQMIAEKFQVFLAGGLNADNVAIMIKNVKPYAVDVASGVEIDGSENVQKIKAFIQNAKGVFI